MNSQNKPVTTTDGLLRCSRYAFGPNRLHYCGPDANQQLASHLQHEVADPGLAQILKDFQTMFPYLRLIADANGIRDAFDERVVEAYWIGNRLLDGVQTSSLYRHFRDEPDLHKKINHHDLERLGEKVVHGAVPHHSFHVLNVWRRTGHFDEAHTLESMDACRIGWGRIIAVDGPSIKIETEPLVLINGNLALGQPVNTTIVRSLSAEQDIEELRSGQIVTTHWGVPCEVVSETQASELRRRTVDHIRLANMMR